MFGFDVDWSVPRIQAEAEHAWTREWGRSRDLGIPSQGESNPWIAWAINLFDTGFNGHLWSVAIPGLFAILLMPFAVRSNATGGTRSAKRRGWLPFIAAIIGVVFWLVTTSVIRHGQPVAWLLAATIGGQLLVDCPVETRGRWRIFILATSLVIAISTVAQFSLHLVTHDRVQWWAKVGGLVIYPGFDMGLHSRGAPKVKPYTTDSGLVLTVPTSVNRCWSAAPLCTPHPAPNLRLRVPGDIGSGFATDGIWLQERWPHPGTDFRERFLRKREVSQD
jgi:hypothetical protein